MNELISELVSILDGANGTMLYPQLLAAWPVEKRGQLPKVISAARATNQIEREISLVNGAVIHTIRKVVTP